MARFVYTSSLKELSLIRKDYYFHTLPLKKSLARIDGDVSVAECERGFQVRRVRGEAQANLGGNDGDHVRPIFMDVEHGDEFEVWGPDPVNSQGLSQWSAPMKIRIGIETEDDAFNRINGLSAAYKTAHAGACPRPNWLAEPDWQSVVRTLFSHEGVLNLLYLDKAGNFSCGIGHFKATPSVETAAEGFASGFFNYRPAVDGTGGTPASQDQVQEEYDTFKRLAAEWKIKGPSWKLTAPYTLLRQPWEGEKGVFPTFRRDAGGMIDSAAAAFAAAKVTNNKVIPGPVKAACVVAWFGYSMSLWQPYKASWNYILDGDFGQAAAAFPDITEETPQVKALLSSVPNIPGGLRP